MDFNRRLFTVCAALALIGLTSCSKQASPPNLQRPLSNSALILSAAASTKEVIESLATQFSKESGVEVKVNLGASSALAGQILAGAPPDLFLSANQQWADEVQNGNQAEAMVRLLTNRLVIVVPKGNPANIREPKDLLSPAIKHIALAGENVPAGKYADQALNQLGLLKQLTDDGRIARGQDVRSALSYVERGEAEAGIVYSTDVGVARELVAAYEFEPSAHDEIVYVLVLLKRASKNPEARRLYEFLQSPQADEAYRKFGFSRAASR